MKIKFLNSVENRLIDQMRNGDETAARKLYNQYAGPFVQWVKKAYPGFPEAEVSDVYQETFITFFYQLKDGKLTEITHSTKTYLFAIGKNYLRNAVRKRAKFVDSHEQESADTESQDLGMDLSMMNRYQKKHQAKIVGQLLSKIGDPCKTVLELAFFHRFAPEAIAERMNYRTEATARVRKVRCLNQLGNMLEKMGIQYEQLF